MNVTDVGHLTDDADAGEDKMEKGAAREGKSVWDIAQFYLDAFQNDMRRLHILPPTVWCRATDEIDTQIDQVRQLEEKGFTYRTDDGIYFDTSKLPDYGKLARLDLAGLQAGARVEMAADKKNPTDFALWKFSPKGTQRLMEWDSPWGVGFPGWHIECSAMAIKHLGPRLDIHCGGIDHVMVHHTNEIAQAECALGHEWCRWWMHGEFLTMAKSDEADGGKMSKSKDGFLTLDVLVDKGYDPVAYRYFLLGAHYRQQLAFSFEALDAAASALKNLTRAVVDLKAAAPGVPASAGMIPATPLADPLAAFDAAWRDDLNMPRALAALWSVVKADAPPPDRLATLLNMDQILGLGIADMTDDASDLDAEHIDALLAERAEARKAKNFARADEIRNELTALGIEILDAPTGTTWRKA